MKLTTVTMLTAAVSAFDSSTCPPPAEAGYWKNLKAEPAPSQYSD